MCFTTAKQPGRPTGAALVASEALAPGNRHHMPCFELVGNGVILQEPVDLLSRIRERINLRFQMCPSRKCYLQHHSDKFGSSLVPQSWSYHPLIIVSACILCAATRLSHQSSKRWIRAEIHAAFLFEPLPLRINCFFLSFMLCYIKHLFYF